MPEDLKNATVAVIGAGVAGLAAADALARHGLSVEVLEKNTVTGGHAARFSCKATESCVKCNACLVCDLQRRTAGRANIRFWLNSTITTIESGKSFRICGSAQDGPVDLRADAVLVAIGFQPFDAGLKPYGYGRLPNVLNNLDAEHRLMRDIRLTRPSDGKPPRSIAFIQCVGSRDLQLHHLWCSKVCCSSALRMAQRIRHLEGDTRVTVFYIDIQTFGKDFQACYEAMRGDLEFVRAIPGDIVAAENDGCAVSYFDPASGRAETANYDMVVLSAGLVPTSDHARLAQMLGWPLAHSGFFDGFARPVGVFSAGTAQGPMNIAECLAGGTRAAWQIMDFLNLNGRGI